MKECGCPNKILFTKTGSLLTPKIKDDINGGLGESLWEMDKRDRGRTKPYFSCPSEILLFLGI